MKIHFCYKSEMNKKEIIENMWAEAFADDKCWRHWFFQTVYDDDEALLSVKNGMPASSLLMQRYKFSFCGQELQCGYIAGASTSRYVRGKGNMSELMRHALADAYARGDIFSSLIPADERLFGFYERFGFAKVVYVDVERYTSLHAFDCPDNFVETEPSYETFHALETRRRSCMVHSELQWQRILADLELDGGRVFAVSDLSGEAKAMALAVESGGMVRVKFIAATDGSSQSDAALAVLSFVRKHFGTKSIEVWAEPSERLSSPNLRPRAMMRIVDAYGVLLAMAKADEKMQQVIQLHDPLIAANNGYYIIRNGECRMVDRTMRELTLSVDVSTLTSIIFSSPSLGEIFGLKTWRPSLDLMLD